MQINLTQVLLQALNFGLLVAVLTKFLYKPILNILKQREDKINEGLKAADNHLKAEAELEKKTKAEIARARREAAAIIKTATADAKKQAATLIASAKEEAKLEQQKSLEKLALEFNQKEKSLDKKLGSLVVAATEKLLSDSLTQKDIERITKSAVTKLK